jgi:hypothetical protein
MARLKPNKSLKSPHKQQIEEQNNQDKTPLHQTWYNPRFKNQKPHLKPIVQNATMRNSHNDTKSRTIHIMPTTEHSALKHFKIN